MSNLNVNFKAPIAVIDALREVIKHVDSESKRIEQDDNWEKLNETQRKAANRVTHQNRLIARFFEVDIE